MLNFNLSHHLLQQLITNLLINWLNNLNWPIATKRIITKWCSTWRLSATLFGLSSTRVWVIRWSRYLHLFTYFTVKTFFVWNSVAVFECLLEFTNEADNFVTIVALLCIHWEFITNHAATLGDELSLEVVENGIWINLHEWLAWWKSALTKNTVYLMVGLDKIVPIKICQIVILFSVHIYY